MSLRITALRGSMVLSASESVVYGSSFVRNMILARLLSKADFGIAATFAMIMMVLEFSSKLGVARFVVQDREGDRPEFLATAHLIQFGAALLSSLLMVAVSWPMAIMLGLRDQYGAILLLALIPLIQGLKHMDTRRFERKLRFGPSALVDVIPQLVITLLAWPLGAWLRDYRAVLVLMILKALMSWGGSHGFAEQPYRWRLQREYAVRMLRFGWPMVINGFLMFFVMRGDQFLVATFYSMGDFGAYAAAASLTMAPMFFFRRIFSAVMMPVMARAQDDPTVFNRRYSLMLAFICAYTAAYTAGVMVGAEAVMRVVFGAKYVGAGYILAWLTVANAVRGLRFAPAVAAIAKGDSVNQMMSNFAGGAGFFPALLVAAAGRPIWMVAGCSVVGEVLACSVSFVRLTRRDGVPLRRSVWPATVVVAVILVAAGCVLAGAHHLHPVLALALAMFAAAAAGTLVIVVLPESRAEAIGFLRQFRKSGWRGSLAAFRGAMRPGTPAVS